MVSHDSEGAFGVVLNRPTNAMFDEVWSKFTGKDCANPVPLFWGGPVEGPPIALHCCEELADANIFDNLFISTTPSKVDFLVSNPPESLRIFIGYSGWGEGQLDNEIEVGGWLSSKAQTTDVFSDLGEDLWKKATQSVGKRVPLPQIDEDRIPRDPSIN